MPDIFANDATLVTSGSSGTTAPSSGTSESWSVTALSALWPSLGASQTMAIQDPNARSEIIRITASTGSGATSITVTRGADSTTPVAHGTGATFICTAVASALNQFPTPGTYVPLTPTVSGEAFVSTGANAGAWTAVGTVDQADTPQPPTASPTPGGTGLASDAGHAHLLPTQAQLAANGALTLSTSPLYFGITNGNITLPRAHQDDSGSYSATPASGTMHYTFFVAQYGGSTGHIRFQTGATAQSGNTYTNVGLYTVNTGVVTLVANGTAAALSGTYAGQTFAMVTPYTVTAGTVYAVGILQKVTTTVASVLGAWFNGAYLGAAQKIVLTGATAQSTLATSDTPTNTSAFPIYYELYA